MRCACHTTLFRNVVRSEYRAGVIRRVPGLGLSRPRRSRDGPPADGGAQGLGFGRMNVDELASSLPVILIVLTDMTPPGAVPFHISGFVGQVRRRGGESEHGTPPVRIN